MFETSPLKHLDWTQKSSCAINKKSIVTFESIKTFLIARQTNFMIYLPANYSSLHFFTCSLGNINISYMKI